MCGKGSGEEPRIKRLSGESVVFFLILTITIH